MLELCRRMRITKSTYYGMIGSDNRLSTIKKFADATGLEMCDVINEKSKSGTVDLKQPYGTIYIDNVPYLFNSFSELKVLFDELIEYGHV